MTYPSYLSSFFRHRRLARRLALLHRSRVATGYRELFSATPRQRVGAHARVRNQTILFRFSILRTLRLLRVFRAFSYQNKILL